LRAKVGEARMIVILEFGSNTMRMGVHKDAIQASLSQADRVICKQLKGSSWDLSATLKQFKQPTALYDNVDDLIIQSVPELKPGDHVVIMSNGGFDGIHGKLLNALQVKS
jgi:UDP-N-acetylmuramate: L-alanyl-gamma-D-glutamyl-meso-diaminopimelate ligase